MTKKITKEKIQKHQAFLDVYGEFYKWLGAVWFKPVTLDKWTDSYDYYEEGDIWFKKLWGVNVWVTDLFLCKIMFLLDSEKHWWMFVNAGTRANYMSLDEMKQTIRDELIKRREEINNLPI